MTRQVGEVIPPGSYSRPQAYEVALKGLPSFVGRPFSVGRLCPGIMRRLRPLLAAATSRGNSFEPTIVRFRPICTDTGRAVDFDRRFAVQIPAERTGREFLDLRGQRHAGDRDVSGLAPAGIVAMIGQGVFFAMFVLRD